MKRASYRQALQWIVDNDDTEWVEDEEPILSVTAALVCDIFGLEEEKIIKDIRKGLEKVYADHAKKQTQEA